LGYLEGLAQIDEQIEASQSGGEERQKAKWVSLKDGESVKLTFLQELDKGSPNYSEKNGLGRFYLEHSNPNNWKTQAECTINEGACHGCANGWRQKTVLYINALVDDGMNEPYVALFSRAVGKGSVANDLRAIAADPDYGNSITDKTFKFSRTGKTKDDTTYTLSPLPKATKVDIENQELWDLSQAVLTIDDVDKQARYYNGEPLKEIFKGDGEAKKNAEPATAASVDVDW
jgi:hypothetical protein